MLSSSRIIGRRTLSSTSILLSDPLYLNPHAWKGLPADRIFELHELRKTVLGDKYVPNDEERNAILSTATELGKKTVPELEYVYALDHFKERFMNNVPVRAPQLHKIPVIKQGETPHKERKLEILNNVAAYEMPLLAKFRQPYTPKSAEETQFVLKFGDDFSNDATPFNRKVTLICKLKYLNLGELELRKFKILSAQRFDHFKDELRITSSHYPEATQNARWLVETFNKLLKEAKDIAKDDFQDIPVDTRHTRAKMHIQGFRPRFEFPEEWKRPQDSPVQKFKIVRKLVNDVKDKKDAEYIKSYEP